MANMSDTKEPVQHEDSNINDDIIDVWAMDFSDPDTWLLQLSQNIADDSIWDSCSWLSKKIDQECNNSQDSKRLIDTRTFTRPKKRSGCLSFESIGETSVSRPSNVWNPQILENIGTKETCNDDAETAPSQQEQEHVPCMLRLSMAGASKRLVQTPFASGHRSLETIRCVSRSNEIDTFVNLAKTESNEDIMEVSQPSVFCSSIMSITTDDPSESIDEISGVPRQSGIEDSQILTESMMEMSMFGDIYDVNFNDTFAKSSPNLPVQENITYCSPSLNTFFAGTVIKSKETLDSTFKTITFDREIISDDATLLNVPNTEPQNYTFNVHKFDATFDKTSSPSSPTKSSTDFAPTESVPLNDPPMMMDERFINETFVAPCDQICDKLSENIDLVNPDETLRMNATFDKRPVLSPTKSSNHAVKESPSLKVSPKVAKNIDPVSRGVSLESFDTTFRKSSPKVQHKLKSPNQLSRLPQLLQKSNPNLGSNSLKLSNTTMRSGVSIFGFNKVVRLSAARNVESSLTTKQWHVLEKTKSSSEQRLDVTRNSTELQGMGSSESTESIASTRSTHSGLEFDDRLSVCSDGSNTSYNMRTMNIDKFQKMIRVREGCMMKQESTPKPCRGVLENNWVTSTNDLPSPILNNSPETYGSRCSPPGSIDLAVKPSSPLLSATQSLQNLSQVYVESNKNRIEDTKITQNKIVAPRKISQSAVNQTRNTNQYKTGIKPPSNWTWADRPASGIPRPRSRISAPTLIRPNTKINQGANKK